MPKAGSQETLARQWELLKQIPSSGEGKTASELTNALKEQGFAVSKRTVERDLNELSCLFGLSAEEDAKPFRWTWAFGKGAEFPSLTVADALSLEIIENYLRPLLPAAVLKVLEPRFRSARDLLELQARTNKNARWLDKVQTRFPAMPLVPPAVDPGVLETVQQALLHEVQLDMLYQAMGDAQPKELVLHPLGLVQRGPTTYLVATAFQYGDARLYALHRMSKAELREAKVSVPEGFRLDAFVDQGAMEFGVKGEILLKARVHRDVATILAETPLSSDQVLRNLDDEWFQLEAAVVDSWQLRWWILGQAESIAIDEPHQLRSDVRESLKRAFNHYSV